MDVEQSFVQDIAHILQNARNQAFTLVNRAMIEAYWEIGRRIVLEEQKGAKKAGYGDFLLRDLAEALTRQLDKRLDERELRKIRQFYQLFPIRDALRPELTWSHYRLLLRVEHEAARTYYLHESANQSWKTRQLERNIQTLYYERILSSQGARNILLPPDIPSVSPQDLVKDPYFFDFLGINIPQSLSESELERALIEKIQQLLLELGKGFAFVGRQYCIETATKRYYIDLVFYNYVLKCFFIADLKCSELTHQDIGQMDMYLRMFDNLKKLPEDNPTIGIILCTEKDETLVKYSVLDENRQLFASRYRLVLPTEEQLTTELRFLTQSS